MASEAPPFWYRKPGIESALLAPVSWLYGAVARNRLKRAKRQKMDVPVICIGNFTVGGTGKTPTAISIAKSAIQKGLKPGILTRGYGGMATAPVLVDITHHNAKYVGDEPLLLAEAASTIVAHDRVAGAQKLIEQGVDIILMDDGFQSAHLWFDYSVLVVDSERGLGNGKIIPAGPVRAPLKAQMLSAHALSVVGKGDSADAIIRIAARSVKPVYNALLMPTNANDFKGKKCLAFAAIGHPDKFYVSLEEAGAEIELKKSFPDHHYFSDDEVEELLDLADRSNLTLVTTSKDHKRLLSGQGKSEELAKRTKILQIALQFDDPATSGIIIDEAIKNFRKRTSQPA